MLTAAVSADSFARALDRLTGVKHGVVLILQPVTPMGTVTGAPTPARLTERAGQALRAGFELLVLPQVHRQLALD